MYCEGTSIVDKGKINRRNKSMSTISITSCATPANFLRDNKLYGELGKHGANRKTTTIGHLLRENSRTIGNNQS